MLGRNMKIELSSESKAITCVLERGDIFLGKNDMFLGYFRKLCGVVPVIRLKYLMKFVAS